MIYNIDIEEIKEIALQAGKEIMEIYNQDFNIEYKEDHSPLTEADIRANKLICHGLRNLYPDIPILSEENKIIEYETRKSWKCYWCIDPIDGTKEFINRNGEFTINIALVYKNEPILGVVYAPALGDIYYAQKDLGAFKNKEKLPLKINNTPSEKLCVVASKSHFSEDTQAFINKLDSKEIVQISKGSSLKLCMVAEGEADIYPRFGPTMEWDTAAADAIVRASGKMTYRFDSQEALMYNKRDLLNPWFIAR